MSEDRATYKVTATPSTLQAFKNLPCALPYDHEHFVPPSPGQVAALIELTGWSQNQVAKICGVNYGPKGSTAVRKWKTVTGSESRAIPYAAWRLLLLHSNVVELGDAPVRG